MKLFWLSDFTGKSLWLLGFMGKSKPLGNPTLCTSLTDSVQLRILVCQSHLTVRQSNHFRVHASVTFLIYGDKRTLLIVVEVAFSSHARILGECSTIHSHLCSFFFFFLVEISWHTLIPLFRPGSVQSSSAS